MILARLLGAIAVILAALTFSAHGLSAPAEREGPDTSAIARFGSCLSSGAQGDVLLVFDTSASLAGQSGSDPEGQRVDAANYLVQQLADYVDTADVSIDIALAGFADSFTGPDDWTALNPGSAAAVKSDIERYRDRNDGFETDYWTAVTGARELLAERKSGAQRRCQAWVWFSDGQLDLDVRASSAEREKYGVLKNYGPGGLELTSPAAEQRLEKAGADDLCREGGVADAVRAQGVITLAVGLSAAGAGSANADEPDFSIMQGVATAEECGRAPKQSPGMFVRARSLGDLYLAFDTLANPAAPPISQQSPLCQGPSPCPEGTQSFVLDASIDRAELLAASGVGGYQAILRGPGNTSLTLKSGQDFAPKPLGGVEVGAEWLTDQAVRITLTRERDQGWVGQWQLTFVDPASVSRGGVASSNLRLFGDISPTVLDPGSLYLVSGESANVQLGLVRGDGSPVALSEIRGTVEVEAVLRYDNGTEIPISAGALNAKALEEPVTFELTDASPGAAQIDVSLDLTTAAVSPQIPGTSLERQTAGFEVAVSAPPNFPTIASSVSFGRTDEAGVLSATLPISGAGCAWLSSVEQITLPEGVTATPVSSAADSEGTCAEGGLPLEIRIDDVGPGLSSGSLMVQTQADNGDGPIAVDVAFQLEMENARNDKVFWPVLVGITLAGLLIPILLLYIVKWRTAEVSGSSLLIVTISGAMSGSASCLETARPSETEGRGLTLEGNRRRFTVAAGAEVLTRAGLGLTEPGFCLVSGRPGASSRLPATDRRGTSARLPLAVQDTWVVLLDAHRPHIDVEVVFLLSPTSGRLAELVADARSKAPQLVEQLRERVGGAEGQAPPTAPATTNDWGGEGGRGSTAPGSPQTDTAGWGSSGGGWGPSADDPPSAQRPRSNDDW